MVYATREEFLAAGLRVANPPSTESECPICREPWETDTNKITEIVECEHIFHETCLLEWIGSDSSNNNTCPMDRTLLFGEGDEDDHDELEEMDEPVIWQAVWQPRGIDLSHILYELSPLEHIRDADLFLDSPDNFGPFPLFREHCNLGETSAFWYDIPEIGPHLNEARNAILAVIRDEKIAGRDVPCNTLRGGIDTVDFDTNLTLITDRILQWSPERLPFGDQSEAIRNAIARYTIRTIFLQHHGPWMTLTQWADFSRPRYEELKDIHRVLRGTSEELVLNFLHKIEELYYEVKVSELFDTPEEYYDTFTWQEPGFNRTSSYRADYLPFLRPGTKWLLWNRSTLCLWHQGPGHMDYVTVDKDARKIRIDPLDEDNDEPCEIQFHFAGDISDEH